MRHHRRSAPSVASLAVFAALAALALAALALAPPLAAQGDAAAAPLVGDTWEATRRAGRGTITAAYYFPLQGFAYRDEEGELTGINIDVMRQIEAYLQNVHGVDVTLRWVPYGDFAELYEAVRTGRGGVIGLAGTTVTEERKDEVSFVGSFFANRAVLVTHPSVPQLANVEEIPTRLAGFTALALRGTTLEERLRELQASSWPGLRIEVLNAIQPIVDRLATDPRTFAYLDLTMYWVARKEGHALARHTVADGPPEELAFIAPHGSDWVGPFGEFFAANGGYRTSRPYRQLMIKHLGVELKDLVDVGEP